MANLILPKDIFFKKMEEQGLALTYDDVRLKTGHSKVLPDNVNIESMFSRNVPLKIPITTAAMDTVTEYKMGIAIAQLGGLGVIHKLLDPLNQAKHVARVKLYLNCLIERPITFKEDVTIEQILNRKEAKGFTFDSFPILNNEGKLVGILTETDFEFCDDIYLTAKEIMTKKVITASPGTKIEEAYKIMKGRKKKLLPLVNDEGKLVGLYTYKDIKRILHGKSSMYNVDEKGQLRVGAAIGVGKDAYERVEKLVRKNVDVVVMDTAHADTDIVIDTLRSVKQQYKNLDVVVGNMSEKESAKILAKKGADGLKVGQGGGSICTTRIIAGIGCPQVTAIHNCGQIAIEYGIPLGGDGGIVYSGDIPIAIGANADYVMIGYGAAGTEESPGEKIFWKGREWKAFRGMGSESAMKENKAARERYLQDDTGKSDLIPEGIEGLVPYRGELKNVIAQYVGGLKRGMGYVGAADIPELKTKADFYRITSSGKKESHPHNIEGVKESINYKTGEQL